MGQMGFLQKSAVCCDFLRHSEVSGGFLRNLPPRCRKKTKKSLICPFQLVPFNSPEKGATSIGELRTLDHVNSHVRQAGLDILSVSGCRKSRRCICQKRGEPQLRGSSLT